MSRPDHEAEEVEGVYVSPVSVSLFFKFGGLATLLRKACGGQASESESCVDIGVHPHGGHLESGIADRVSVRIDQHQTGRAGAGFIRLPFDYAPATAGRQGQAAQHPTSNEKRAPQSVDGNDCCLR